VCFQAETQQFGPIGFAQFANELSEFGISEYSVCSEFSEFTAASFDQFKILKVAEFTSFIA
jgi:hypothetical protein